MADDINPGLRAELHAALDVLAPQLRGLADLTAIPVSGDLGNEISAQFTSRTRRQELINAVLSALDAAQEALRRLIGDGYPDLPPVLIAPALLQELQADISDVNAATSIFTPAGPEQGSFNPGSAVIT